MLTQNPCFERLVAEMAVKYKKEFGSGDRYKSIVDGIIHNVETAYLGDLGVQVKDISKKIKKEKAGLKASVNAVSAQVVLSNDHVSGLLGDANLCASHGKRVMVQPKDIQLVRLPTLPLPPFSGILIPSRDGGIITARQATKN